MALLLLFVLWWRRGVSCLKLILSTASNTYIYNAAFMVPASCDFTDSGYTLAWAALCMFIEDGVKDKLKHAWPS